MSQWLFFIGQVTCNGKRQAWKVHCWSLHGKMNMLLKTLNEGTLFCLLLCLVGVEQNLTHIRYWVMNEGTLGKLLPLTAGNPMVAVGEDLRARGS